MRRALFLTLAASVTLLSCTDEPPTGLGVGGIALEIHTVEVAPRPAGGPSAVDGPAGVDGDGMDPGPARTHGVPVDSARVVVTSPALSAPRIVSATPGTNVTIDNLPVGTYGVELQGWGGGLLAYRGNVTGVQVQEDRTNSVAQVLFAPTSLDFIALGETVQLVSPAGTVWSSAQTSVVQVTPGGLVTAIANGAAQVSGTLSSSSVGVLARVAQVVDSVSVTPATATIAAGATQQFTAKAFDSLNVEITGVSVLWVSNNQAVATISPTGLATGAAGGTASISAAIRGIPASATLTVNPPVATQLAFIAQPANTNALEPFPTAVQVEIRSASGARITSATDAVTLAIGTNPGGGTLTGTRTVNAVNGVATFSGLSIDRSGTGYTLSASSGSLTSAASAAFNVAAPPVATQLAIIAQPVNASAYDPFPNAVQVEIRSASGARVTSASDPVTLAIGTNPAAGTLAGTRTVNAVNGVATFTNLRIDRAGTGYTLAASSGSLTGATSNAFDVSAAVIAGLRFVSRTDVSEGTLFTTSVEFVTSSGFRVTSASGSVTLAIGTNPASGTLSGTLTTDAVAGLASFTTSINAVGAGYTLTASTSGLPVATSDAFDVVALVATRLRFFGFTTPVAQNAVFGVSVQVENSVGTRVTTSPVAITLALGANPGGGTLSGTTTLTTVNGIATFPISVDALGVGYTLTANSPSLTGATSSPFDIVAGAPTHLVFITQPSSHIVGDGFAVVVEVRNALGNRVTGATNPVTVAFGANPGGGVLSGIRTVNAVDGRATISPLAVSASGASYTLTAVSAGLTGATSVPFDVVDPPTQLRFIVEPPHTRPDQRFMTQVELLDAGGQRVTVGSRSVFLAFGANPGGAILVGSNGALSVSGVATFTSNGVTAPGAGYTIVASSSGLTSDTSTPFDVGRVTVFTNTSFVQYTPGNLGAEGSNLVASYQSLGHPVTEVTGITDVALSAALANARVFAIPEQEVSDVTPALNTAARTVIRNFVSAGGTLQVHTGYGGADVNLINTLFGFSVIGAPDVSDFGRGFVTGTSFAGGPATLIYANGTWLLDSTSLPVGSQVIYGDNASGDAAVAVIPYGLGQIIYMGWDWFNAQPVGTEAGGPDWIEVMRRAARFVQ
jgi:hypothetical protein